MKEGGETSWSSDSVNLGVMEKASGARIKWSAVETACVEEFVARNMHVGLSVDAAAQALQRHLRQAAQKNPAIRTTIPLEKLKTKLANSKKGRAMELESGAVLDGFLDGSDDDGDEYVDIPALARPVRQVATREAAKRDRPDANEAKEESEVLPSPKRRLLEEEVETSSVVSNRATVSMGLPNVQEAQPSSSTMALQSTILSPPPPTPRGPVHFSQDMESDELDELMKEWIAQVQRVLPNGCLQYVQVRKREKRVCLGLAPPYGQSLSVRTTVDGFTALRFEYPSYNLGLCRWAELLKEIVGPDPQNSFFPTNIPPSNHLVVFLPRHPKQHNDGQAVIHSPCDIIPIWTLVLWFKGEGGLTLETPFL